VDIPATIIPLTWPYDPNDSHSSSRFESAARTLRYQALGQACKEHRIEKLLVAHHADDQAETVLMRLMNMRWRSGLQGMQAAEWIPECHGLHGVHHSGTMRRDLTLPMQMERGGVQIFRPLLGFRKDQLIATCEQHHIPWAEDKSNQDPTLTLRNAIRHVFKENRLPAALSFDALLALGDQMKARVDYYKDHVERLLGMREVMYKLDIQTGSLSVRFPPAYALIDRTFTGSDEDIQEARNTAFYLLARIASYVDFKEDTSLARLSNVVSAIWPELDLNAPAGPAATNPTASVCAFGLLWRKTDSDQKFPNIHRKKFMMDWLISRQPPESHELGPRGLRLEYPPAPVAIPLTHTASPPLPDWQLFDRWWFQVKNHTSDHTIVLRFITDNELHALSASTKNKTPSCDPYYNIKISLELIKPAALRRSLPALFLVSADGKDELIALPTLGVKTIFPQDAAFPNPPCTFDVRYKKIDSRHRQLKDIIARGIVPQDKNFVSQKRLKLGSVGTMSDEKAGAGQWSLPGKEKPAEPVPMYKRLKGVGLTGMNNPTRRVNKEADARVAQKRDQAYAEQRWKWLGSEGT
jgi:tRNA(Ile)-lysidine synthase